MFNTFLSRTRFSVLLALVVSVAIVCLAIAAAAVTSYEASRRVEAYVVGQGARIVESFGQQSRLALLYGSYGPKSNSTEAIAETLAFPEVAYVQLLDAALRVVDRKSRDGSDFGVLPKPKLPVSFPTLQDETKTHWTFVAPVFERNAADLNLYEPGDPSEPHNKVIGYAQVLISKSSLNVLTQSVVIGTFAITFTVAGFLLLALRLLSRRLLDPLNNLAKLMLRFRRGERGERAVLSGPKDIIDMGNAFNSMMDVLDEREAELRASRDSALKTAMMKSQFAAMVSHEIRTPLNGVVGMLDLLKDAQLPRQHKECVDVAWSSAKALMDLTNDVLDVSKLEAGKLELEARDFDLHRLMEDVFNVFTKQAQQKGLQLAYTVTPSVPDMLKGDSLRLRQVVMNLVGNAVKFTEAGEVSVIISASELLDRRLLLRFEVIDTGIGLSTEAQEHIFDYYTQAEQSITRRFGGTGLGLAICKQIVKLMGGEIGVVSTPNEGSTFWFSVIFREADGVIVGHEEEQLVGRRVLVVEENDVVRSFIEQVLNRYDMHCKTVASGEHALAALKAADRKLQNYDLAIINSGITDENGVDLERRIRSEHWAKHPAMLLLDLYAAPFSTSAYENCIVLGKPVSRERLVTAMRQLLANEMDDGSPATRAIARAKSESLFRTLVVEDNRTNQMVVSAMLRIQGAEVAIACNGQEAINLSKQNHFDLILMDCSMPEMDGYEATAHLRRLQEEQGRRMPIVALTANTEQGQAEKCAAAGMDDYLAKPITLDDLRVKIDRWVFQERVNHQATSEARPSSSILNDENLDLDEQVMAKMRSFLGANLNETLLLFMEDIPRYLDDLDRAIADGRKTDTWNAAHSIKGSSGNLGARKLAAAAAKAETLTDPWDEDGLVACASEIRSAFDQVAMLLTQRLATDAASDLQAHAAAARVLVVDDDRSTRSAIRFVLQREGFEIVEAVNGEDALRLLEEFRPDIILMDAVMPVMDGFAACSRIIKSDSGRDIPIIMITALDDKPSIEKAFAAGACDFVTKPLHFTVLSQRLRRIIAGNSAERKLKVLSSNDPLTALPNRAMYFRELESVIGGYPKSDDSIAVFILNIDRFRAVNDAYGHSTGDALLKIVAERLATENLDYVARLGADEFALFAVGHDDPLDIANMAQKICTELSTPFQIGHNDVSVTASLGISLYPRDAETASGLLKCADVAMHRAKKQRSGFHFFENAMELQVSEQVRIEADLRHSLQRGELELYYQHQVDIRSAGSFVGMEALLRWNHPSKGLVQPADFISIAEETGLIHSIGAWVLTTVCSQINKWDADGVKVDRVGVNVAVSQLLEPGFSASVAQILANTGCDARRLELEVAETVFVDHADASRAVMDELNALGIRLCIDDFGTGFTTLSYLSQFPVRSLKIDRLFLRDVPGDADDMAIIKETIELAHSFGLEVVAEGVERVDQETFLRENACDVLQGFLYSRPVPAWQVAALLAKR